MGLPILSKLKKEVSINKSNSLNKSNNDVSQVLASFDASDSTKSPIISRKKYFLDKSGPNHICQWKVLKEITALSDIGKCVCISMDTAFEIVKTEIVDWKEFDDPMYINIDESEFPCPYKYQL